jgi:acyl carrier protein
MGRDLVDYKQIEIELQMLCQRRGITSQFDADTRLSDLELGSLDVSELVIRLEERLGYELDLGAVVFRELDRVGDLVEYMCRAVEAGHRVRPRP